jgi:pimeloyl-ACP methyl ester carboxylesterase
MAPNGQYDKIGLHRLIKTGTALKGVILVSGCPMWGMGEQRISNPATDNWTKTENYSPPIYWANHGYDVYAIDYRTNFVPKALNASQMAFAANWGWDVWVSDIKEAAEKVKEVSKVSKFFISGECSGGEAALNYAAKYWKDDLRGIILLDAHYPGVNGYPIVGKTVETNTYNMTKAIANMNIAGTFANDTFRTLRSVASYALQNPGAPAAYPPGTPLNPPLNPITNNSWANITEWFASRVQNSFGSTTIPPGSFSNLDEGYGDISQVEYCFANNQFLPSRLTIETTAMADWANCPYLKYDYNDHYSEIGVPVLAYAGPYVNQTGGFRFMLGINNTDFTGNYMPKYGHLDILFGTFSARDIGQPAIDWMLSRYQSPVAFVSSLNLSLITGQTAKVTVTVSGGVPPYTYQWYEGTNAFRGQINVQLVVIKISPGTYTYYCSILDAERTNTKSDTATLTFAYPSTLTPMPIAIPPSITAPTPTVPPSATEPTTTPTLTQSPIPQPSTALPIIYAVVAFAAIYIVSISALALKKRAK